MKEKIGGIIFFLLGFHELSTDDILATTDLNSYPVLTLEPVPSRQQQRLPRALSTTTEQPAVLLNRPVGIAEPVRRLSGGIIRAFKFSEGDTSTDKSVQVNTIIRSCGRCAGSTPHRQQHQYYL